MSHPAREEGLVNLVKIPELLHTNKGLLHEHSSAGRTSKTYIKMPSRGLSQGDGILALMAREGIRRIYASARIVYDDDYDDDEYM